VLNNITVKNKYPLPLISSAFAHLHGATVFTKSTSGMPTTLSSSERETSGKWHSTHHLDAEYLVMLVVLTNTPADYQNPVNDVLRDVIGCLIFVYLDDIQIFF
jgi:hypothetical protein